MFNKKTLHEFDINNKIVLLRTDYNVPISKEGKVESNYRIAQSLPTIKALQDKGCKIIICSHLGRPKSSSDIQFSLKPVGRELGKLLKQDIIFVNDCVGDSVKKVTSEMKSGEIVMLENLRFHPEEKKNDAEFANSLVKSTNAEVLVQDAFGVVHRSHASTDAIAKIIPGVAGLLVEKEVREIERVMNDPSRPLMAIIGGAKIADKIDIIEKFIEIADVVVIGGAMANTFLKAQDIEVGESLVDEDEIDTADDVLDKVRKTAKHRNFIFYLPQDGVVSSKIDNKSSVRIVDWDVNTIAELEAYPKQPKHFASKVKSHEKILDIGPVSGAFIAGAIQMCNTVVWNGTMGVTEISALHGSVGPFSHGTETVIDGLVGKYGNKPFSLVGGGDTTAYIEQRKLHDMFNHVSTGGGASLELMAGHQLPGVAVLWDK